MTMSDKVLTPEYLDWYAKLSGLPSILTNKIHINLYKKYGVSHKYCIVLTKVPRV